MLVSPNYAGLKGRHTSRMRTSQKKKKKDPVTTWVDKIPLSRSINRVPFLCAQRAACVDGSGRSRHVRRRGARSVAVSVDPSEGTVGQLIPPADTFARAPQAIWKRRQQWVVYGIKQSGLDIISHGQNPFKNSTLCFWW